MNNAFVSTLSGHVADHAQKAMVEVEVNVEPTPPLESKYAEKCFNHVLAS